jgi:hypothetical protein
VFECELCWRARAGPGSFVGRAFRAGPARMGLCSAVLGQNSQPVERHGPARLIGRAQTGSGWAGPCRPFGHLYTRELSNRAWYIQIPTSWFLQQDAFVTPYTPAPLPRGMIELSAPPHASRSPAPRGMTRRSAPPHGRAPQRRVGVGRPYARPDARRSLPDPTWRSSSRVTRVRCRSSLSACLNTPPARLLLSFTVVAPP